MKNLLQNRQQSFIEKDTALFQNGASEKKTLPFFQSGASSKKRHCLFLEKGFWARIFEIRIISLHLVLIVFFLC